MCFMIHCCFRYGAFSYDLAFQFETLKPKHERSQDQKDISLYIPDSLIIIDQNRYGKRC